VAKGIEFQKSDRLTCECSRNRLDDHPTCLHTYYKSLDSITFAFVFDVLVADYRQATASGKEKYTRSG
jgi:hypothetical protein